MKINWTFILNLCVIGITLFLFGFANNRNEMRKIAEIDVQFEQGENLFMDYEMVNKLLIQNEGQLKNKSKSLIDLNGLEKQVLAHPMVEHAATYITVDGLLRISIKQRSPIARINTNTESYYIDRQGKMMPLSQNYSARVPIVSGFMSSENTDDLYKLLTHILNDDFLQKQIIGIHKNDENDFVLKTRIGNHEVEFGKIENLKTKFENLKTFYAYAMPNQTIDKYKKISLKYNNQVVCTKKAA